MTREGFAGPRLERAELASLERALEHEWLETDGRGGYAASTVHLCNTRRYHGLLVAPFPGTVARHVFLSRLEEHAHFPGAANDLPLSTARYSDVWSPAGWAHAESFEALPVPRWTYRYGNAVLEREFALVRGAPLAIVRWRVRGADATVRLSLRPLFAARHADHLQRENLALDTRIEAREDGFVFRPYSNLPAIELRCAGGTVRVRHDPVWYRGAEYAVDRARGYDHGEDLVGPAALEVDLEPGRWCALSCSILTPASDPLRTFEAELARRATGTAVRTPVDWLARGADDFLYLAPLDAGDGVQPAPAPRGEAAREASDSNAGAGPATAASATPERAGPAATTARLGVVAGFPWFLEWGRDTCIALPGLLLARDRVEECGRALEGIGRFVRHGLVPNVFGRTTSDSHYGSVDASLWFARAVALYDRAGGAETRLREVLLPKLTEIAERYIEGTRLGVASDPSGLLRAGSPDLNATWMDARTSKGPVTPRNGCAVELNALWIQLLSTLSELEDRLGLRARALAWRALAEHSGRAFLARFWLPSRGWLADVVRDDGVDDSVRPNMVIAAALEASPLSLEQRASVVQRAEIELVTPRGLRTLSPAAPEYKGQYGGGVEERDGAYHQGTAWPWLFGFFVEASLRAWPGDRVRAQRLRQRLDELLETLAEAGLGHVSEVFDGDPPQRPGGTFAQAWNTGELLRADRLLREAGA